MRKIYVETELNVTTTYRVGQVIEAPDDVDIDDIEELEQYLDWNKVRDFENGEPCDSDSEFMGIVTVDED